MEEILLKQLRKQMNIKYRFLTFVLHDYTLYVYGIGIRMGFNWKEK